ncbi:hypothetical protein ACQFYA_19085 [Promicromonospora sp. Marseille-Q5078]
MPRRRRSGVATDGAGSGASGGRPDTGPIVLPPLEAPVLPDLADDTTVDGWRPPAQVESSSTSSLPSRHRAQPEPVAAEPEPVSAPVLGVDQRAGLFSSFRSMGSIDVAETESTLQLDAVTEDPAALPDGLAPLHPAEPEAPVPSAWAAPVEERVAPAPSVWAPAQAEEPVALPEPYRPATEAAPAVAMPTRDAYPAPVARQEPVHQQPVHHEPVHHEPAPTLYAEPTASSFDPVVREVPEPAPGTSFDPVTSFDPPARDDAFGADEAAAARGRGTPAPRTRSRSSPRSRT